MPNVETSSKLSLRKRASFFAVMLLITVGLIEAGVWALFRPVVPDVSLPSAEEPAALQNLDSLDVRSGRERAGLGFRDPSMSLHPYLGYVFLPKDRRTPENPGHPEIAISDDGFLDAQPSVRKRRAGRVIVGVTGGSVSGQLGTWYSEHMEAALHNVEAFRGLEPDFVWLGMPGYHQPQQAIQLIYVLAQGGEFDYVVNLDGFNELAVPGVLNAPQGAHPLFPMNWSMVALDVPDPDLRRTIGAIDYLRAKQRDRNGAFSHSPWRLSPTARFLRQRDDARLEREIAAYTWELQSFNPEEVPYFISGPQRFHVAIDEMLPELVDVWTRASLQMNAICEAFGIRYLHCLQPNQYDPGSKPLSREELEKAFDDEGPYKAVVEAGYPMLRAAGQELVGAGVSFHDLSRVFEDVRDTLYKDNCCHFNAEGNRILAEAIADAIEESM